MGTKGLEKVFKNQKLTPKEAAEINAYVGYTVRGMIATSFFAFGIHKMLSTNDNEFDLLDNDYAYRISVGKSVRNTMLGVFGFPIYPRKERVDVSK